MRTFSLKKLTVCLALAGLLAGCGGGSATRRPAVESAERQFTAPAEGDLIAIFTTSLGEIRAVLYPDVAPMAVENFVGLARTGYYDGTVIWRCEPGFAVQGGDATGTGSGNLYSSELRTLRVLDRAEYEALAVKDPGTLYLIRG